MGANAKKFAMKSRIKVPDSATRDNPPPNNYHVNHYLSEPSKFSAITFGFGTRVNVNGCKYSNIMSNNILEIKDTPGPGTYKLPSAFDKFKRLPPK